MTATAFEDRPETTRGRMLYRMLLAVHAGIRQELARVEGLAASVLDGLPVDEVHKEVETLRSNGTLWQFQLSCLRYCRFVQMHHHAEDLEFFEELEQTNPAITSVVERLRADHRAVSDYLDAVEAATRSLSGDDGHDARQVVADALDVLEEHLLAHLEYEELNVETTAKRLHDFSPTAPPERDSG
jgi:Hemerythrin HHE cation binding domain